MSANEELIARLRGVVEDALEDSLQVENEFCVTDAEHEAAKSDRVRALSVRDDVIATLEQVTAERDNWKLSAEEAERAEQRAEKRAEEAERERDRLDEAFDRDLPWRYDEVETQRNQLAAVVEQVRDTLEHYHGQKVDVSPNDILDMLPSPSVALDRVKAEAVRVARDAIMPPVNCELRYDGTEDPGAAEYVGIMHEVHDRLSDLADRIEKGERL